MVGHFMPQKEGVLKVYFVKIWKKYIRYNILTLQTL